MALLIIDVINDLEQDVDVHQDANALCEGVAGEASGDQGYWRRSNSAGKDALQEACQKQAPEEGVLRLRGFRPYALKPLIYAGYSETKGSK